MKSNSKRLSEMPLRFLRPVAFSAAMLMSFAGTTLSIQAADSDNISTEKSGAVVLYSTPLAKGASPNLLVSGGHPLSFSKKGGAPHLIVIDLGKSYKLNDVQLSFSKSAEIKVFVLKTKPDANTPWANALEGLQPTGVLESSGTPVSVGGAQGEYLVLVSDQDPGKFSGLYVTGTPFFVRHELVDAINQGGSSTLAETPHPASDYETQSTPPSVPPQSN